MATRPTILFANAISTRDIPSAFFAFCQCLLPNVCSELFPVLQEHIGVGGLRWVFLKLIWDVEGHGKLRLAGGAGSRDHVARDWCGHLHLGL